MDTHLAAALRFRQAIEETETGLVSFQRFPAGACGDASELLAEYYRDCGLGEWLYRMGVAPGRGSTHGWIEQDGLLADITADQFPNLSAPAVQVGTDWSWHDLHFPSSPGCRHAGLDFWDGPTHAQVSAAYRTLRAAADQLLRASEAPGGRDDAQIRPGVGNGPRLRPCGIA